MHRIERRFPGMAERRVSEIMAERNGFGQILIQIQRPRNRAGNLGYLECVGQAGPVMISLRAARNTCVLSFILRKALEWRIRSRSLW